MYLLITSNLNAKIILSYGLVKLPQKYLFFNQKLLMTKIEEYIILQVKRMREERDMSQAELADLMNLSHSFIGQVESGNYKAKYNLNHLNSLAKIFKCKFSDFFPDKPFDD